MKDEKEFRGLCLVLGRAGAGKTAEMYREIASRCREGRQSVLIVPEMLSHEAEMQLQAFVPDGSACLHAEVLSFTRLATRVRGLCPESGAPSRSMDRAGRLLCMAVAAENVRSRLKVYKTASLDPDTLSLLLDAMNELKTSCIAPRQMEAFSLRHPGALGNKMSDMLLLTEAYDAVAAAGGMDPADPLTRCAQHIGETEFVRAHVYIDGFADFTGCQLEVIRALLLAGTDITVCLTCEGLEESLEIFEASRGAAVSLLRMAEEGNVEHRIRMISSEKTGPMAVLEKHLFSFDSVQDDPEGRVSLFTAPTLSAECEMAAAKCLSLVRGGCRWRDIAIAIRGFDSSRSMLESMFSRYGVPLYCAKSVPLSSTPVPSFTLSAYRVISGGWSTEDMMAYLKTGLAGLTMEECDELDLYSYMWSIRGASWYGDAPFTLPPDGFTGKDEESNAALLQKLNVLRAKACHPLRKLEEASAKAQTALEQAEALASFYEDIALPQTLENAASALEKAGKDQEAATMAALWEKTVSCLEQYASILGSMPQDSAGFCSLFGRMLSTVETATIPLTLDKVTAGDMDRMRRRTIRHLLVLECDSSHIPSLGTAAGIFSDDERETLSASGLELGGTVSHRLAREYALLYNTFTLPSDTITLSYCPGNSEGAVQPAFLYRRCGDIFSLTPQEINLSLCRLSSPVPRFEEAASAIGGNHGPEALAALASCSGEKERLEKIRGASTASRGHLSERYVRLLYGRHLSLSASRAEKFASCKYAYFLRYTMNAQPRQKAEFNAPELGIFLHWMLENIVRDIMSSGGFEQAKDDEIRRKCEEYASRFISEKLNDFHARTERFEYLFRRLCEDAEKIVLDTVHELSKSSFRPLDFELNFGKDMSPVSVGEGERQVSITGIADRVDGWVRGDDLLVRIVDYKSGHKKFSFTDVWNGLGLQMLMYLFAIQEDGGKRYGKNIVPAGVLYVPARNSVTAFPSRPAQEDAEKKRRSSVRRSGLILDDPEVWTAMEDDTKPEYIPLKFTKEGASGDALASAERIGLLSRHVKDCLSDMAKELRRGAITADPWFRAAENRACTFCEFASVCSASSDVPEQRRLKSMKSDEFWQKLEEKYSDGN